MSCLPTGTVTFLFTDIEGSTQLWENHPEEMKSALARHDTILREAIRLHHGHNIKSTGDGVHAVFERAADAIQSALGIQHSLQTADLFKSPGIELRVRLGMHTGEAEIRDGDYYGQSLNLAARIMSAGHGGQILVSGVTAQLAHELECIAYILSRKEEPERAVVLLSAAEAIRRIIDTPRMNYEQVEYEMEIESLRNVLDPLEFERCWEEGSSLTMEKAIQFAIDV